MQQASDTLNFIIIEYQNCKVIMVKMKDLTERIIINPDIMVGKPIIKGTRITVEHILGLLAQGISIPEIIEDYPHIHKDDIYACLAFAKKALESSTFMAMNG